MKNPEYRYPTTLSQDEQAIANEAHGRNATPVLHKDLSALGLVTANCGKRERSRLIAWKLFVP